MNKERELEILKGLRDNKNSVGLRLMTELLQGRRERYRDALEGQDDAETRGKCKEIKDLLKLMNT